MKEIPLFTFIHYICLLLVGIFLPIYLIRFSVASIPTNILEIWVLLAIGTGIASQQVRDSWHSAMQQLSWQKKTVLFTFICACTISIIISPHLRTSLGIYKGWIILPMAYGWMTYAISRTNSTYVQHLLSLLTWSGTVMALLAFMQIGQVARIHGIYDTPNSLALFLAPLTTMAGWIWITTRSRIALGQSIIMGLAIFASQTFMGVLSVGVGLACGIWKWHSLSRIEKLVGAIVLIGTFIFFIPKIEYLTLPFITPTAPSSASVRLQLWYIATQLIYHHPLLGIGLGTFEPFYQEALHQVFHAYELGESMFRPIPEFVFRDPHNWILSFWLNTGIIGLVSFTIILCSSIQRVWKEKPSSRSHQMIALALITIGIFGLTDTIYWKNDLAFLFWLLASLL